MSLHYCHIEVEEMIFDGRPKNALVLIAADGWAFPNEARELIAKLEQAVATAEERQREYDAKLKAYQERKAEPVQGCKSGCCVARPMSTARSLSRWMRQQDGK